MTTSTPHPMLAEATLPDGFPKEFLAHAVEQLKNTNKVSRTYGFTSPQIEQHVDGHVLGAVVGEHLPDDMKAKLNALYSGEGPPVLVLHNFPIPRQSHASRKVDKMIPNREAEFILEGLSFIMSDQPGKPHAFPTSNFHSQVKGSESLDYHTDSLHDSPKRSYLDGFACIVEGGKDITTNFRKFGYGSIPSEQVPPGDEVKVTMKNGDIVLFRDSELTHARHNPAQPYAPKSITNYLSNILKRAQAPAEDPRVVQRLEIGRFAEGEQPEGWQEKLHERARELMTPPTGNKR